MSQIKHAEASQIAVGISWFCASLSSTAGTMSDSSVMHIGQRFGFSREDMLTCEQPVSRAALLLTLALWVRAVGRWDFESPRRGPVRRVVGGVALAAIVILGGVHLLIRLDAVFGEQTLAFYFFVRKGGAAWALPMSLGFAVASNMWLPNVWHRARLGRFAVALFIVCASVLMLIQLWLAGVRAHHGKLYEIWHIGLGGVFYLGGFLCASIAFGVPLELWRAAQKRRKGRRPRRMR